MTKARDIASATTPNANAALLATFPHRNLIINGAMQVAQRGTSFSSISSDQHTLDRFIAFHTSVTPTITQESLSVGQTDLPSSFRNYLRFAAGTGAAILGFGTRIEDVSKYYGTYKLSFYAKGTNPAGGSFQQRMIQRFGTGGSSQVITDNGTFTVTSSWQRFEIDVTVPSVSGKTIGAGNYLQIQFNQPSTDSGTSAWTLDITGIQLELGDTATDFEHHSYGDELAKCQRYYQQWGPSSETHLRAFAGSYTTGVYISNHFLFPTIMRATPSFAVPSGPTYQNAGSFGTGSVSTTGVTLYSISTSASVIAGFYIDNNNSDYAYADAEL
jgi:hypothetical protein